MTGPNPAHGARTCRSRCTPVQFSAQFGCRTTSLVGSCSRRTDGSTIGLDSIQFMSDSGGKAVADETRLDGAALSLRTHAAVCAHSQGGKRAHNRTRAQASPQYLAQPEAQKRSVAHIQARVHVHAHRHSLSHACTHAHTRPHGRTCAVFPAQ